MTAHDSGPQWGQWGKRWGKRFGLGTLAGAGALLAYGIAVEPRLTHLREYEVHLPRLPEEWYGRRVALASDFQVGMFLSNTDTIRRLIRRVIALRADAFLFAGDFIYHPSQRAAGETETAKKLFRPLIEAGIPVVAVLGNHDYGVNEPDAQPDHRAAEHVRQEMENLGVHMLQNTWVALPPPGSGKTPVKREDARQATGSAHASGAHAGGASSNGHHSDATHSGGNSGTTYDVPDQSLYIVGIGSKWMGEDDPQKALQGVPDDAARIALMHNPYSLPKWPAHSAPLALAGHTHGGQVRVPGTPNWSYLTLLRHNESHADGWVNGYGQAGNDMYVTIGVGFSGFPARINAMPELALFTLQPESAGPGRWAPLGNHIRL